MEVEKLNINVSPEKYNSLSPEKKAEVDQLIREINKDVASLEKRLKESRIEIYNTGVKKHAKQIEFHSDTHRIRALFGGNRTGKTTAGAFEAVCYALGYSRFKKIQPSSGWVVSLTNEVQRDVAQKEIIRWLPKKEIKDFVVRHGRKDDPENSILDKIILKNGQVIGFKTVEQGRESFQGTSQGWIWFDEEPDEPIYKECRMRLMDTRGDMWFTMTPLKGLTWIYKTIYLNEKGTLVVRHWFMEWEDNPWLSEKEIEELVADMPEEERAARQYGKFTSLCGFAFPMLKENVHIRQIEAVAGWYKRYVAIDYGLDCLAAVWVYVDKYGYARVYRELSKKNLIVSEAAKEVLKFTGNESIEAFYAPPDLWNRRNDTGKSAATIFYENGITLIKTSNDRETGWLNVREWLKPIEIRHEQTGEPVKTAMLTFDVGSCPELWRCMTMILKDEKNINDVATTPHDITHLPDALRAFCTSRMIVSSEPDTRTGDVNGWGDENTDNNSYFGGEITDSYLSYGGYL